MKRVSVVASVAMCVASLSCKSEQPHHEGLSMRERVSLFCSGVSSDLKSGADEYAKDAPALDSGQLSPEQVDRTDQALTVSAIGVSHAAQQAKLLDLQKLMQFCVSVREIDAKRMDDIVIRFMDASEPIIWSTKHVEKARALDELAAIAHEIDALPLWN